MAICGFNREKKMHWVALAVSVIIVLILIGVLVFFFAIKDNPVNNADDKADGVPAHERSGEPGGGEAGHFHEFQKEALKMHNDYREKHHAPPMKLVEELNELAHLCAEYYAGIDKIDHSCTTKTLKSGAKAGENLYMGWGLEPNLVAEAKRATKFWYDEVKDYTDYSKPTPDDPPPGVQIGHFTQLVWVGSKELGVGYAKNGKTNNQCVVALYLEHGNVQGEYVKNVLPP